MKIQFIILYVYRIPAQCTISWFAAVVQWTNKVVGQVAFASEYLCLFLFVQGHPLSQLAFCLMNIFISFIHSTEGPHVLPGISTREECYSFPSECGTSAVNTSVSSPFHLIRGTDQFYWLVLSPGNGNSPSWEAPVLCSGRMVLHDYSPHHSTLARGSFRDQGQRRESLTFSIFSRCKYFEDSTVFKSSQCGLRFQLHSPA